MGGELTLSKTSAATLLGHIIFSHLVATEKHPRQIILSSSSTWLETLDLLEWSSEPRRSFYCLPLNSTNALISPDCSELPSCHEICDV